MFAAGCVGSYEDIMEALGLIANILGLVNKVCKGKVFPRPKVGEGVEVGLPTFSGSRRRPFFLHWG